MMTEKDTQETWHRTDPSALEHYYLVLDVLPWTKTHNSKCNNLYLEDLSNNRECGTKKEYNY